MITPDVARPEPVDRVCGEQSGVEHADREPIPEAFLPSGGGVVMIRPVVAGYDLIADLLGQGEGRHIDLAGVSTFYEGIPRAGLD